nr:sulfatase [Gemmatales bacterium]
MRSVCLLFYSLLIVSSILASPPGTHSIPVKNQTVTPKNIVLIVADDLGFELGCYGHPVIKTPHVDALASNGVRFTHAFATTSSCSASRSVIMTGQYNHTNGQYGLAHAEHHFSCLDRSPTLPALLQKAGYYTGLIGKDHVLPRKLFPYDYYPAVNGRSGADVADRVETFVDQAAQAEKPFYLLVGFIDPHLDGIGFANQKTYRNITPGHYRAQDFLGKLPRFLPEQAAVQEDFADYANSVHRLDQNVGKVLAVLERKKLVDSTLIIFLSDNGIPFPGAKTTLYDSGIHLPLIIQAPQLSRRGTTQDAMVSWVDIAPTIIDWAQVSIPKEMAGRSFLTLLRGESSTGWDKVYLSHTFHEVTMYYPMRGLRTRQYKYLWNLASPLPYPFASDLYASPTWKAVLQDKIEKLGERNFNSFMQRPVEELYDIIKDPYETKNLA